MNSAPMVFRLTSGPGVPYPNGLTADVRISQLLGALAPTEPMQVRMAPTQK